METSPEGTVVPIDRGKPPERIVHELSNLLAIAIGQAEYLLHEEDRSDPNERRECLKAIRQAVLDAREKVRRLPRATPPGAESESSASRTSAGEVWQALFGSALEALAPGQSVSVRIEKHEDAVLLGVPPTGLALPEALIFGAGGSIDLGDDPSGESALTIRLPVRRDAGPPGAPASANDGRGPGLATVLIIDDQEDVREAMAALLRQSGHRVDTAATGAEGVEHYHRHRYDCVVTDMSMPGLNGLMVSRAIKDHDRHAYVILLTGAEHDGEPQELRAAGVDRMMVKPLSRSEILGLVDRDVVDRDRSRAQGGR